MKHLFSGLATRIHGSHGEEEGFGFFIDFTFRFLHSPGTLLRSATFASFIRPLRITSMAAPRRALHRHGHAKECTHVGDGMVEFLKVHIQRLAFGTARLLVEPDALHVEAFENRLVEKFPRILGVRGTHIEFDAADEV